MIFDCKAISSITAVLDKKMVKFITFNQKKVTYESKNYFITNIYAFLGENDAVRLRKMYPLTEESQITTIGTQLSQTLQVLNKKYNILVFEGGVKDEDSSVKLFMKY